MTNQNVIQIERGFPVAPAVLWSLWTEARHLSAWFGPHISLEPRAGGAFREVWTNEGHQTITSGTIVTFDPPKTLAWTWADEDWTGTTLLTLSILAERNGVRLTLIHSGWHDLAENASGSLRDAHAAGWTMHLTNLERYCLTLLGK
ncbi:hypothetical protein BKI51_22075 [Alphaproteobacteria bacterium AO1-B]|nr:hypothetical protein BKI51_22075 [Alphaproteobacteria bacterium AO1-B]